MASESAKPPSQDFGNGAVNPEVTPENNAAAPKHHRPSPFTILIDALMQTLSWLIVKLLMHRWIYVAFKEIGFFSCEWPLNFLVLNGGIFGLFGKLVTFGLRGGRIVWPLPEDEKYASNIGHMDPRTELFLDTSSAGKAKSKRADQVVFPDEGVGSRKTVDVCVMAAKLAYENPVFVERVVTNVWNMYYVKFFHCWNEYQKMHNTQAFVFMDKKEEANAIVVAFRGTELFNTYDWSTDFDFHLTKLKDAGSVHLGFLEALGLASRKEKTSLEKMANPDKNRNHAKSGLTGILRNHEKSLAFDDITFKVRKLMDKNPNAKLFITGHSLGGALATLYPVMLHYFEEDIDFDKIGAVYTFGQPRVGDEDFSKYASEKMKGKYFRYVYCNDVVPRIPFDGVTMKFKHFGESIYFNSVYDAMILTKEPSPNYIGFGRFLGTRLNAIWEMFQAMILITFRHGKEYSESKFSLMNRMMGLLSPGTSAHSPTNYVNAVRLGHYPPQVRSDLKNEFHLMMDNVIRIVDTVWDVITGMAAKVKGIFVKQEE